MEHDDNDIKVIMEHVNSNNDITIDELVEFIYMTLGTKWNNTDKQTIKYLNTFLQTPNVGLFHSTRRKRTKEILGENDTKCNTN